MTAPVRCEDCHRPLRDPDSKARGRGPVCQAVLEGDTHIAPKARRPARRKRLPEDQPIPGLDPTGTAMTDEDKRTYAEHLIFEHARDVEYLSVFEMYEEWSGEKDAEIADGDAAEVHDLLSKATITIAWPDAA